ncbi:hypothetical protein QFC21_005392 [Naganishia friedmannii]|uniref:Uncharacterized protein n=1 Tax=Naganishia friedmannii TaxID=89922 RepID=A0ACC2VA85_9TREE|nr:hypothetical protein QFC21_005392 [Naganishia friedmannii]
MLINARWTSLTEALGDTIPNGKIHADLLRVTSCGKEDHAKNLVFINFRAIPLIKKIFPMRIGRTEFPEIKLLTIWFGTNDSDLPSVLPAPFPIDPEVTTPTATNTEDSDSNAHTAGRAVPLDQYKANLNKMLELFLDPTSDFYLPGVRIVLLTPPPVVVSMMPKEDAATVALDHTRQYKDACLSIGQKWSRESGGKVQVLDCWKAVSEAAGGEDDDLLRPFFVDGVHLTSKAYRVLFDELMRTIKSEWDHLDPANIKPTVPVYNAETDGWKWSYEPKPAHERKG